MSSATGFTRSLVLGLIALFLAALLSELATSPSSGSRIDVEKLPPEAQAILKEQPGLPISADQWKRLDQVMARSGGWPKGAAVFWASVRSSWYWFLALPLLGLGVLHLRWKAVVPLHTALVLAPSLAFLFLAFTLGSAGLKV
ncbi:hypothetical protein [Pseudorhodoferax sp.]|uniref:hypothetical protein n=1 Tax=Pseudorhodoferax sp. TaxID=1993553 RepID=UPI002DD63516|nr:hypothetical protein [Pseudorhodoferax sp.]